MELLIFVLILFTIVFVIYLCGHITETLEEIKIVRNDLSHYYNAMSVRLDAMSNRLDDMTQDDGESECDVEIYPDTLDKKTVERYFEEAADKYGLEELYRCLNDELLHAQDDDKKKQCDCIDACEPETCPVTGCKYKEALGDPLEETALNRLRYEELVSERKQQNIEKVTFAATDDIAQDDGEPQRDCIDDCDPETCPVEDCKHKEAFKWSLLS